MIPCAIVSEKKPCGCQSVGSELLIKYDNNLKITSQSLNIQEVPYFLLNSGWTLKLLWPFRRRIAQTWAEWSFHFNSYKTEGLISVMEKSAFCLLWKTFRVHSPRGGTGESGLTWLTSLFIVGGDVSQLVGETLKKTKFWYFRNARYSQNFFDRYLCL